LATNVDAVAREARAEALADEEPVDEGLAAERTELAWSRSGLAMMACGVVVARGLPTIDAVPRRPVVGVTILGLGAVAWALGLYAARRRRAAPGTPRPVARWRDLAPVAVGSTVIGVAAFFLVVFQRA
jgi:uncharacterized membrane protein YidH (DUF202 family)